LQLLLLQVIEVTLN